MAPTTSTTSRSTPLVTSRLATPPPRTIELREADTPYGWIAGTVIGFHGFRDEIEAAHAAWVAHRTMARRVARERRIRPIPIDTEPMSLARSGEVELILAGGRPIATLVRPGPDSRSGPRSFGFALEHPVPADELTLRATAHLVYRTLRRAGIRWSLWSPAPAEPRTSRARPEDAGARSASPEPVHPADPGDDAMARVSHRTDASGVAATLLKLLDMLAVVVLPAITASVAIALLVGAAVLFASAALASLVRLVATDLRDARRRRATDADRHGSGGAGAGIWTRALHALSGAHPRQPVQARPLARST